MNAKSEVLWHLWDQGKHYDFFMIFFDSVNNYLLTDNEIAPFFDKLKKFYPIASDLPGGLIDKEELNNLGFKKIDYFSDRELILMNHYWAYIVKDYNNKRHYQSKSQ
jgi:hypothetical protein